jgi:hypothetical protein
MAAIMKGLIEDVMTYHGHKQDITHVRAKDLGCDIAKDGARYGQNR